MSSKERLCVACGHYIGRWLIGSSDGPLHLRCWLRTGGPFYRERES